MYSFVMILRAFACFLITNFHSDILYPDKLSILAFGGDLGNNLFFALSGFSLFNSVNKMKFNSWLKKRYFKILPTIYFMLFLSLIVGSVHIASYKDAFRIFIFPTLFWFTGAITIFYIIFYPGSKILNLNKYLFIPMFLLLSSIHIAFDGIIAERYVCGLLSMLLGYLIRIELKELEGIKICSKRFGVSYWWYGTALSFGCYGMLKIFYMKKIGNMVLVHYGIGMLTIAFDCLLIIAMYSIEPVLKKQQEKWEHNLVWKCVDLVSSLTMYIYLVLSFNHGFLFI